jgi:lysophospholipase L1-like esterase
MHVERPETPETGRRGSNLRLRLAFAAGALLVGALALEMLTRVVFDRNGMHFGIEMWKYAKQVKRVSAIPAMGHEHAPNRSAILMGVPVRTNSLGLRDREFSLEKPAGVRRVLVLGDSMTLGWGAREEDSYPKVLERLLNEKGPAHEVINTGVGNYNTAQEVAYFRERGIRLNPDEVVLGFYINDAEPTPSERAGFIARHSYFYVLAASGWDAFERRRGWKEGFAAYYRNLYSEANPGWRQCQDALRELSGLCRDARIGLRLIIIPELHAPGAPYAFRDVHRLVAAAADREGIPVLDLVDAFDGVDPPSLWVSRGDAHPSASAHRIIANALFKEMTRREAPDGGAGSAKGQ